MIPWAKLYFACYQMNAKWVNIILIITQCFKILIKYLY